MVETVTAKVTIEAAAVPGKREIRLATGKFLTNPLVFYVGQTPEYTQPASRDSNPDLDRFLERLGGKIATGTPKTETWISLPATVNGQILPGGTDAWRFKARRGQRLVVDVSARDLIPYLADAVPGWFEAVITLADSKGNELAHENRFRFRPDPVLLYEILQDGDYIVTIKDSLYRGRPDFVYRCRIGELPYITGVFPLGGPAGKETRVDLTGWNLPSEPLTIDNQTKLPGVYSRTTDKDGQISNPFLYAVDGLPECLDREPNNNIHSAQKVVLPVIINGRIDEPGDMDVLCFEGHTGDAVVAEVQSRRLGSPLDSNLKLTDAGGRQLAFNDDYDDTSSGLETHHADSYLSLSLPSDGKYYVHLGDSQGKGGREYAYRLRIGAPSPDFALRVVPSSLSVRAGASIPVTVYALRKDGFTNAIELALKNAPAGFELGGARIPAGQDKLQFTLKASSKFGDMSIPANPALEGTASIQGRLVARTAVPAEDMMQAFAYRHLVPACEWKILVVDVPRPFAANAFKILSETPLKLKASGSASVRISTPSDAFIDRFDLELEEPPEGVTLENVSRIPRGMEITFRCDASKYKSAFHGNLIVRVFPKARPQTEKPSAKRKQKAPPIGSLPAIPVEIGL